HAEVEGVQEPALADPPAPLDELLVHDRDLAGRPAEADQAELEPEAEGLPFAGSDDRLRPGGRGHRMDVGRATNTYSRLSSVNGSPAKPPWSASTSRPATSISPSHSFFVAHHSELCPPSSSVRSIRFSPT